VRVCTDGQTEAKFCSLSHDAAVGQIINTFMKVQMKLFSIFTRVVFITV